MTFTPGEFTNDTDITRSLPTELRRPSKSWLPGTGTVVHIVFDEASELTFDEEQAARIRATWNRITRDALERFRNRDALIVGRFLAGTPCRVQFAPQKADLDTLLSLGPRPPRPGKSDRELEAAAVRYWDEFQQARDRGLSFEEAYDHADQAVPHDDEENPK